MFSLKNQHLLEYGLLQQIHFFGENLTTLLIGHQHLMHFY